MKLSPQKREQFRQWINWFLATKQEEEKMKKPKSLDTIPKSEYKQMMQDEKQRKNAIVPRSFFTFPSEPYLKMKGDKDVAKRSE